MKCSNPDCNRGIGLISYQRGWFDKRSLLFLLRLSRERAEDCGQAGDAAPRLPAINVIVEKTKAHEAPHSPDCCAATN
jgi:hypothetical protein